MGRAPMPARFVREEQPTLRMSTRAWDTRPKRICIVQLGRIGDLLLITPLFSALKAANPHSELHLLAGRNNYKIVEGNPFIDRAWVPSGRLAPLPVR